MEPAARIYLPLRPPAFAHQIFMARRLIERGEVAVRRAEAPIARRIPDAAIQVDETTCAESCHLAMSSKLVPRFAIEILGPNVRARKSSKAAVRMPRSLRGEIVHSLAYRVPFTLLRLVAKRRPSCCKNAHELRQECPRRCGHSILLPKLVRAHLVLAAISVVTSILKFTRANACPQSDNLPLPAPSTCWRRQPPSPRSACPTHERSLVDTVPFRHLRDWRPTAFPKGSHLLVGEWAVAHRALAVQERHVFMIHMTDDRRLEHLQPVHRIAKGRAHRPVAAWCATGHLVEQRIHTQLLDWYPGRIPPQHPRRWSH